MTCVCVLYAAVTVIAQTIQSLFWIGTLVTLSAFIFALLSMQLFGGVFVDDQGINHSPRTNFDGFYNALISTFQMLTVDWAMTYDFAPVAGIWRTLSFTVAWIVVGHFVLLNLFLVIIIDKFQAIAKNSSSIEVHRALGYEVNLNHYSSSQLMDHAREHGVDFSNISSSLRKSEIISHIHERKRQIKSKLASPSTKALGIFEKESHVRTKLLDLEHLIDTMMIPVILLSCVVLAAQDPRGESTSETGEHTQVEISGVAVTFDVVFAVIFSIEMLFKLIAHGLLHYIKSGWNQIDLIVVSVSWACILAPNGASQIHSFRVLRALRPIRVITHFKHLRLIVNSLLSSLSALASVLLVCMLLWFVFAIVGMSLFKGTFWSCNDTGVFGRLDCSGSFVKVSKNGASLLRNHWVNPDANFDNMQSSLFSLWCVSTLDSWWTIAYDAIDMSGVDLQPQRSDGASRSYMLYFVLFIIMADFFFLNLFIGVIYSNYRHQKEKPFQRLDWQQKQWLDIETCILKSNPRIKPQPRSNSPLVGAVFKVVQAPQFEMFIDALIVLNAVVAASWWYGQDTWMLKVHEYSSYIFTLIFALEVIAKIFATGMQFFRDKWNVFDLVIVSTCVLEVVFLVLQPVLHIHALEFSDEGVLQLARLGRILRLISRLLMLFRLLDSTQGLRRIFSTVIETLPPLTYMLMLLFTVIFMFGIIATNLFKDLAPANPQILGRRAGFNSLPLAMLTLFGIATGDAIMPVTQDCLVQWPDCCDDYHFQLGQCGDMKPGGCGSWVAYPVRFVHVPKGGRVEW